MAGIDGIDALAALMRRQFAALQRQGARGTERAGARSPADRPAGARRTRREDLAEVVARRVHGIDPADPDAARKAFRLFLESVLLAEFGEDMINDPAFYRLVDEVHQRMQSDASLVPMMDKAGALMLSLPASR